MKTFRVASYIFLLFLIFGCSVDPWKIKSYVCDLTKWISPHNFQKATYNKKKFEEILVGNIVIVPFLSPTGKHVYEGEPPYYFWLQAFSEKKQSAPLIINSIHYETNRGQRKYLTSEQIKLVFKNNNDVYFYADKYFEKPIDLDFENKEKITITIDAEILIDQELTKKSLKFNFYPKLKKGLFKFHT